MTSVSSITSSSKPVNSFEELIKNHPEYSVLCSRCNTKDDYIKIRKALQIYNIENFKDTETKNGVLLFKNNKLNVNPSLSPPEAAKKGFIPFTFFSTMKFANPEDQALIPQLREKYIILRNKPELGGIGPEDPNWKTAQFNENASMSAYHQFVGVKNMNWDLFNVLTFGLEPGSITPNSKEAVILMLNELQTIGNAWAESKCIPREYLGLYFHVYPFNSVQSLHMHMVDKREQHEGVAMKINQHKNMPISEIMHYFKAIPRRSQRLIDKLQFQNM
jgi:hypothetical protein